MYRPLSVFMLLAVMPAAGCVSAYALKQQDLPAYEDPEDRFDRKVERPGFELNLNSELRCSGTQMMTWVAIKNTGAEKLAIDPSAFYLQRGDERVHNITHATDAVSGDVWWINKLLKAQEIEPGVKVAGLLVFPGCHIESGENVSLVLMDESVEYQGDEQVSVGAVLTWASLGAAVAAPLVIIAVLL